MEVDWGGGGSSVRPEVAIVKSIADLVQPKDGPTGSPSPHRKGGAQRSTCPPELCTTYQS